MKPRTDVDKLYATALGRLDDVSRYLDEWDQLRASKAKGNGNGSSESAPECAEAAEEDSGSPESSETPDPPAPKDSSEPPSVIEGDDDSWEDL